MGTHNLPLLAQQGATLRSRSSTAEDEVKERHTHPSFEHLQKNRGGSVLAVPGPRQGAP